MITEAMSIQHGIDAGGLGQSYLTYVSNQLKFYKDLDFSTNINDFNNIIKTSKNSAIINSANSYLNMKSNFQNAINDMIEEYTNGVDNSDQVYKLLGAAQKGYDEISDNCWDVSNS